MYDERATHAQLPQLQPQYPINKLSYLKFVHVFFFLVSVYIYKKNTWGTYGILYYIYIYQIYELVTEKQF